ncbi:MAG: hypothetical protein WBM07_18160 [Chitinivibrionales bacterium]
MHDPDYLAVWIWCLLEARFSESESILGGKKVILKPGQFTTGRRQLALSSGVSESKVERVLTYFETEQQIEQQKTSTNRLISIRNWTEYQQSEQPIEQQMNNDWTTNEQRLNTLKECKERKNDKKEKNAVFFPLAENLKTKILQASPEAKINVAQLSSWANDFRLMIEQDFRTIEQVDTMIDRVFKDAFWKNNIRSAASLRDRWNEGRLSQIGQAKPSTNEMPGRDRVRTSVNGDPERVGECLSLFPTPSVKLESKEDILRRARGKLNAGVLINDNEYKSLPEDEKDLLDYDHSQESFDKNHGWRYFKKPVSEPAMAENENG